MAKYTISTKEPHDASVLLGIAELLEDKGKGYADIERVGAAIANLLSIIAPDGIFDAYANQQYLAESSAAGTKWKVIRDQCRMLGDNIDAYFTE